MQDRRLEILSDSIETAVKQACTENITVSYSGGIDSTLVAFLANKYSNVELIAVGTPKSYDLEACLLYTSPSPRDRQKSLMPSSA